MASGSLICTVPAEWLQNLCHPSMWCCQGHHSHGDVSHNQRWWPSFVMSSSNLEVMSVCVLLPRSPLSWWHQQVNQMWYHIHCTKFHGWMSPSMEVTGQPATTQYQSQCFTGSH